MARYKYLVTKRGNVIRRRTKEKTLKSNYKKVAKIRGKPVYQKITSNVAIKSRKYKIRRESKKIRVKRKAVFRAKQYKARIKPIVPKEEREQLVEVKGLVSAFAVSDGIARRKNSPFSAEMLFIWWGNKGFDERRLLNSAWEILLDSLASIDRINMPLISSLEMKENRGGIESITEVRVQSTQFNEMEYTVFIPDVHGKAYFKGSAKVVL